MSGLLIIGAGGHGKVCADIAERMGKWDEIAFVDDGDVPDEVLGVPVLGTCAKLGELKSRYSDGFVAVGNAQTRLMLLDKLEQTGYQIITLCHPDARIGKDVTIGKGTAVMAGVVVNPSARIGKGCIINTSASVDHDCVLEDGVHISVGAHIAGTVRIAARTWVGIGAVVSNNLTICSDCMIGAGAVVVKDIEEPGTYVGLPAHLYVMT